VGEKTNNQNESKIMLDTEAIAGILYDAYCAKVGGKAFNGDDLPTWKTFRADPSRTKQSDAWVVVAETAIDTLRRLLT